MNWPWTATTKVTQRKMRIQETLGELVMLNKTSVVSKEKQYLVIRVNGKNSSNKISVPILQTDTDKSSFTFHKCKEGKGLWIWYQLIKKLVQCKLGTCTYYKNTKIFVLNLSKLLISLSKILSLRHFFLKLQPQ